MFPDLSKFDENQVLEFSTNLTTVIANKLEESMEEILPKSCQDTAEMLREAFYNYDQDYRVDSVWGDAIEGNSLEAFQEVCPSLTIKDIQWAYNETIKALPFKN